MFRNPFTKIGSKNLRMLSNNTFDDKASGLDALDVVRRNKLEILEVETKAYVKIHRCFSVFLSYQYRIFSYLIVSNTTKKVYLCIMKNQIHTLFIKIDWLLINLISRIDRFDA